MTMRNVGTVDAGVRIGLGLVLLLSGLTLTARPLLTLGAAALAVLILGTGVVRSCPLYVALGLSTWRHPAKSQ
jgi:hypothetical protein